MVYPALLSLMRTPRLPVVDCTDVPVDLNGLVLCAERRNLVSARVPSHFKRSLLLCTDLWIIFTWTAARNNTFSSPYDKLCKLCIRSEICSESWKESVVIIVNSWLSCNVTGLPFRILLWLWKVLIP